MNTDWNMRLKPEAVRTWVQFFRARPDLVPLACPPYLPPHDEKERNWQILRRHLCEGAKPASLAREYGVGGQRIHQIVGNYVGHIVAQHCHAPRNREKRPRDIPIPFYYDLAPGANRDDPIASFCPGTQVHNLLAQHGIATVGEWLDREWEALLSIPGLEVMTYRTIWKRLKLRSYVVAVNV